MMSGIKQLVLFLVCCTQLQAASVSVINSGLVSTLFKIGEDDHLLVSMIIPAAGLQGISAPMGHGSSLLKICVDTEVNRQKQAEALEIRTAGYDGTAMSPKSMALDLLDARYTLAIEKSALKRKLDVAKAELSETKKELLEAQKYLI
jgi:hypothetical protein